LTTEPNSAILKRIAKLLALSDAQRNTSEAEASLAAAKAQELLQEYNLTLADIEAGNGSTDEGAQRDKKTVGKHSAMYAWQTRLMETIAEGNFCLHRVRKEIDTDNVKRGQKGGTVNRHQLVGRKVNVEASQMMYAYLLGAMDRLVVDAGYSHSNRTREYHCWLEGCADRLADRLKAKYQASREASQKARTGNGTGRELVLADVYGNEADMNNDTLNGFPLGTTATRRKEQEAHTKAAEQKQAELMAQGVERIEAYYLAHGYGAESAKAYAEQYHHQSQRRGNGRGYRGSSWTAGDQRRWARQNSAEYKAGAKAGESIGLESQVGSTTRKRIGGK